MDKTGFTLEEIRKDCSDIENKILDMYLNRKKQKEMMEELGVGRGKIDHLVERYKLTRFRDKNNYCIDETVIDINNPEYCYFLGLFASDGNLHLTNSGSEIVQFTMKDRDVLEDVKKLFRYTGEIKTYKKQGERTYYFLGITNKKLVSSLKEIFGNVYRKTSVLIFPEFSNNDCLSMFMRGFWDGDGCFTLANSKLYMGELYCDSVSFMNTFCKHLENLQMSFSRIDEKRVSFSAQKSVTIFIDFIYSYDSTLGMARKRGLAMLHKYYYTKLKR